MKKKLLAWVLTLAMIVSIMPTYVFAEGTYGVGDQFTSEIADAELPTDIPDGTEWSGPSHTHTCDKDAHTHSMYDDCFEYQTKCNQNHSRHDTSCYVTICGKNGYNHRHTYSCYKTELICVTTEHEHGEECPTLYIWTLVEKNVNHQYRDWWPVYWDFDIHSSVRNEDVVSVTASNETVKFSDGEVVSSTALKEAAEGDTATVKDVRSGGFEITVEPGYYVTHYRLVCGNHTGCGVTSYADGIVTENTENSYTATVDYLPPVSEFDHWYNIGGMHNNPNKNNGVYQPVVAPQWDASKIYHTHGTNTLYPFYLLIEVKQDTKGYSISYDWGELSDELADYDVPAGENNLLRNTEHTVKEPGEGGEYADHLGFVFKGWKVVSDKYDDDIIVQPGSKVTIYGDDIELVAQWAAGVSYEYTGDIPEDAPRLPKTQEHDLNETVEVADTPELEGYKFIGWESDDVAVNENGYFAMPKGPVVFEGEFVKDERITKDLSYTVEYYFNGHKDASIQEDLVISRTVWIGESDYLPVDTDDLIKTFEDWEYEGSLPDVLPSEIKTGKTIRLYYTGTNVDLSIHKQVRNTSVQGSEPIDTSNSRPLTGVKIGDVLEYRITVFNNPTANAVARDVVVYDTLNGVGEIDFTETDNIEYSRGVYEARGIPADIFTIKEIGIGEAVTITYTYEVLPEDEGQTLVNFAIYHDGESGDSAYVQVDDYFTLTVEHYADGQREESLTKTYIMKSASSWAIATSAGDDVTYVAPKSIEVEGTTYALDPNTDYSFLSGTLEHDTTVELYYFKDEIGGGRNDDDSDDIPDKYQVTFIYETTEGGTVTGITKEVVNVYDSNDGEILAEKGIATASGTSTRPSDSNHRYALDEHRHPKSWTLQREGHVAFEINRKTANLSSYQLPPEDHVNDPAKLAVGGYTYVFTAPYEQILPTISIDKQIGRDHVSAGTNLEYIIHVKNTGNVDLTNIVVNDVMTYVSNHGYHTDIPEYRKYISELRVTGVENAVISDAWGSITIPKLEPNQTASIEYVYVVQTQDTGKKIHNVASVTAREIWGTHSDQETVTVGYIITYTDGVEGKEVFKDQVTKDLKSGDPTPAFKGNQPTSYTDANGHTCIFTGWEPEVAATVTDSITYVAQWEIATAGYIVKYYTDSIAQDNLFDTERGTGNIGDEIPYTTDNAPNGYKFDSISGETEITETTADNILNVLFVKDTFAYTVNYYKDSIAQTNLLGSEEGSGLYGAEIPYTNGKHLPEGYKTPGAVDGQKTITSVPENNVLNIVYSKNSYKVTYKYEGTVPTGAPDAPAEQTYQFKAAVEIEVEPTLDGYTFSGWKINNKAASNFSMPANDVTITGSWTKNSHTIVYKITGDYFVSDDYKTISNVEYGTELSLTTDDMTKTGYTFSGWSGLPATMPDEDVVVTGSYTINKYKITFVDEDGSVLKDTTEYSYGTKAEDIVKPATPTKEPDDTYNYVFAGWTPAIVDVTADATYKAIYTPYTKADLKVQKIIASIGGATPVYGFHGTLITKVKVGDEIVWDFVIENLGQTATKVTLTDVLKIAGVETKTVVDIPVITLAGGERYTLKSGFKYIVKLADAEKIIANTAIAFDEDGKQSYDDSDEMKVEPAVIVSKMVNKTHAKIGELLTYTITVKNNSNIDLENLTVADEMLDKTVTINKLSKNGVWTKDYEYYVTSADAGKKLVNTVIVKSGDQELDEADSPETKIDQRTPGHPKPKPQLNIKDHYAYIVGYPDGMVHPERNITRAEVSTIFFRMLLDESREYFWAQTNDFTDVPADKWFNNAVSTLANANLITGYPDGSFKPNANITRAEFATIAIRFFLEEDVEITENNLTDVKGHWAEANIDLAYAFGLINGYPDDTFRPNQLITRAEAMTIVNRVLKRAPHKDYLLDDMIQWPDNMNENAWYYTAVQEATNSHEYHMTEKKGEEYEIWAELLPVRDWAALEREWSEANSSKNPGEVVDININTPEAEKNGLTLN